MKNVIVDEWSAADLRAQFDKVLRGLGRPEPPLDLALVRELQRLDRQYYSSTDNSAAREFVSRLRVGVKQVIERPTLLWDVIRKADLRALYLPDRKRILIDSDTPEKKQRWAEAHEVGHSLAPWHEDFLHGDSDETLHPSYRDKLEAEANYAASQLLFMQGQFAADARDLDMSIASVVKLSKRYGNSITSTLWRYVEEAHRERSVVGLITPASKAAVQTETHRYCIESPDFRARFGTVAETMLFGVVDQYCAYRRGGPVGSRDVVLVDVNGVEHVFHFESFSIGYSVLTLAVYRQPVATLVSVAGTPNVVRFRSGA
jgi:Zn-dependent peptidase ImmA (M78 family)